MADSKGFELTDRNPGWVKKDVPKNFADDDLKKLVLFYVIYTPCTDLSSSSISMKRYGWDSDNVWRDQKLKNELFEVAGLVRNDTFISVKTIDMMKEACQKANMTRSFCKNRQKERIVIYKPSKYNEFLAICYHIRNAFAHGRLAVHSIKNSADIMFVLEDGLNYNGKFQVRSRMILKKSTLLRWIEIIDKKKLIIGNTADEEKEPCLV